VKLAAGFERQQIGVDLGSARGNPTVPLTYRTFSRNVDSEYAELLVPVVSPSIAIPAVYRLDLNAAVRHDNYDDVAARPIRSSA